MRENIKDENLDEHQLRLKDSFPSFDTIPDNARLKTQIHQKSILINGKLIEWDGPTHMVFSPILVNNSSEGKTEKYLIGSYPLGTPKEASEALAAAVKAYNNGRGEWSSMSIGERISHLKDFTYKMVSRKNEIVKLIVWEIGKTFADAEKEFERTVEYINETINSAKKLNNSTTQFSMAQNFIGQIKRVPHGVVLCMGPFNYPLNETFTTLIPALIMGNTILFKPPKHGTLVFQPLLDAFAESFPIGVVNTVYGRGRDIVPGLMESGKVDVLALIGSSRVADRLKKMHPKSNRLKAVLGLDAKNAAIVLPDADLSLAVKEVITGALSFNGQRCTALKIIFVDVAIVDEFNALLVKELKNIKVGMPWQQDVTITPLAEPDKPAYLKDCIDDALLHGAGILNAEDGGGSAYLSLMQPAVIYPVNEKMKLYNEEQFGPVIPIAPFDVLDEPIDYIINSPYGQQVSIFGQDSQTIAQLIDNLAGQVGRININSQSQRSPDTFPFNGRKDSAEGTLSVEEALFAFSVDSVVATKQTQGNEKLLQEILINNQSRRLNNSFAF